MVTKEQLKLEIEKVADEYIDPLYKIIKALEKRGSKPIDTGWLEFIEKTYGCMQDNPIKRGEQDVRTVERCLALKLSSYFVHRPKKPAGV